MEMEQKQIRKMNKKYQKFLNYFKDYNGFVYRVEHDGYEERVFCVGREASAVANA